MVGNYQNAYLDQLINLAEDAVFDGNYTQAKRLLDNGLAFEPGYAKLHYTYAWMYHYHQVDEPMAERHYKLTLWFDAHNSDALEELTELFLKRKQYGELMKMMLEAEKLEHVDKVFVYRTIGGVAERKNNYSEAIWYYRKALIDSMDNDDVSELKQNIKRAKLKRFKTQFRFASL